MEKISRLNPAIAKIVARYPLTESGSSKETWHLTLDTSGIDFSFEPGDSIGIYPQNDPTLVDHLIRAMRAQPDEIITHKRTGKELALEEFLTHHANLARITSSFLKLIHQCEECPEVENLLKPENKAALKTYLTKNDPLDLLRAFVKSKLPLQALCDQFGPLLPRYFSIASSKVSAPNRLDLTVALFTWEQNGEKKYGVASHFLCYVAEIGKTDIPFYVQPAEHFRLPKDHSTDIIMIGPGTGIAPFRAFMQERIHHTASGRHWLFFGERNKASDFFYKRDWEAIKSLRLSTAFSRDQKEKLYVQHKLQEHSKEVYDWLTGGAHLYVCGDAKEMAKDVEKALQEILIKHGSFSETEARDHLRSLKKEGRYNLDVY